MSERGIETIYRKCPDCRGAGRVREWEEGPNAYCSHGCYQCSGNGYVPVTDGSRLVDPATISAIELVTNDDHPWVVEADTEAAAYASNVRDARDLVRSWLADGNFRSG